MRKETLRRRDKKKYNDKNKLKDFRKKRGKKRNYKDSRGG